MTTGAASAAIGDGHRALVTGGAGFIGSHVVERLVARGARVTVLDDLSTGDLEHLAAVADAVELDRRRVADAVGAEGFLDGFDVVFHLAANPYIPPSVEDPAFDYEKNLATTFRLLEAMRRVERPPRLVNTSSAAVYGDPARLPIREADPTVPISPYGVSKLAAERYVDVFSRLYGLRCSSVRLFSVFGPRQRKQVVYDLIDRCARDPGRLEVYGDGSQERDFVFVEDVADAMLAVAERAPARGEAYNVASGTTHSIRDLVAGICETLGVQPQIVYSGALRPGDADRWSVDTAALGALGFDATVSLDAGLARTRDWYRTHA